MNFLSKRKLGKNSNPIVRLAITHFDRPTDLKIAFLDLDLNSVEFDIQMSESFQILRKYPYILDDIRLAYLRALCGSTPSNYATVISKHPDLLNDSRANMSIEFYKNKTLNEFLGIKDDTEEEMVKNIVYTFDDTMFEPPSPTVWTKKKKSGSPFTIWAAAPSISRFSSWATACSK